MDTNLRHELEWLRNLLYTIIVNQETKIMPALDTANANLQQLSADVQELLSRPSGGVPEQDVQSIADAIQALDATVKAALGQ